LAEKKTAAPDAARDAGSINGTSFYGTWMDEILKLAAPEREIIASLRSREGLPGEGRALIECCGGEDAEGCGRIPADTGLDRNLLNARLIGSPRRIDAGKETQTRN
jgi:hypothetical protein